MSPYHRKSRDAWWIATILQLIGVFSLASNYVNPVSAYIVMLFGSGIAILAASIDRNEALWWLNVGFTLSNMIGIVRWS